ncbi:hypothetical protein CesoFtcFv8_022529 [Champsocephalus esox]|uniref:Uncharacterized protein n=1 Tax=Champsocephalus esox TaxID=159716 RepID=A0AAN8GL65_9TELE|nr:hypothetical protein CesoFtcFv8_022529 [Champsocephalus esox]
MSGVFSRVHRVRSDPVWPRFPAIRKYQEGAAADPGAMRAPIRTYVPLTRVVGFTDVGFPTVPPLEPNLTAFFGARQASTVTGRQPMLDATKDRFVARQTDRMHQCAFQASAAANNIALLSNSMVEMSEQSKTMSSVEAEEIGKAASTALTLCAAVAVSQARIAVWATQVHRYLWLQQGNILEGAGKDLLEAPISLDGLFGPQFHTMVETMKSAAEQADDIRRHASWFQDSKQLGSLYKPAVFNQSVIRQQGTTFKSAASILTGNKQRGFSSVSVVPTHSRIKPSTAVMQEVKSTAHTSTSWSVNPPQGPVYEPSHKQRQDESRGVMQRVETPAQPFRAGPPLGCVTSNGGKGSGMASHHDYHSTTKTGTPAERCSEWRRLCLMDGWMSRLISRGYSLQFASPPPPRGDSGNTSVIPRTVPGAPDGAAGTPGKKCDFQGSSGGRKSGVLLPLFSYPEKDRGE